MGNGNKTLRVDWHPDGDPCGSDASSCGSLTVSGSESLGQVLGAMDQPQALTHTVQVRELCARLTKPPQDAFLFVHSNASIVRQVGHPIRLSMGASHAVAD